MKKVIELAEAYSNSKYGNYSDSIINAFEAGYKEAEKEIEVLRLNNKELTDQRFELMKQIVDIKRNNQYLRDRNKFLASLAESRLDKKEINKNV